jgi:hypothetical protein
MVRAVGEEGKKQDAGCDQVLDVSACRTCDTRSASFQAERPLLIVRPLTPYVMTVATTSGPAAAARLFLPSRRRLIVVGSPAGGWNFFSKFLSLTQKNMCRSNLKRGAGIPIPGW